MVNYDDPFGAVDRVANDPHGVRLFDDGEVEPGLIIFHTVVGNEIVVIDMGGNVVLKFDRAPEGYRMYRPGKGGDNRNIYCILKSLSDDSKRVIASLNESGHVIWKTSPHHFTHDFHIRHNRRIVSVLRSDRNVEGAIVSDNVICEMDIEGNIKWRWSILDHINQFHNGRNKLRCHIEAGAEDGYATINPFHVNSIQIADYPVVIEKLGEPAVVASARNLNSVFFIGLESMKLLYEFEGHTIGQHHARVLPEGYAADSVGNLIIVDNGYDFLPPSVGCSRGYSRVLEINIPSGEIVWKYEGLPAQPPFYSPIVGAQQRFRNGNTLITEGYYGRLFEIDYDGNIVWDYVYPPANEIHEHLRKYRLRETGLRQIYRAYKVMHDWMD